MPVNKNAYLRYLILDNCLRSRSNQYTLDDLISTVNSELIEERGLEKGISKRTIQLDIQHLREEFKAPIVVKNKKYYQYSDTKFSITEKQLNNREVEAIEEAIQLISQVSNFSQYSSFQKSIQQLQAQFSEIGKQQKILHLEEAVQYDGIKWLQVLFKAAQEGIQIELFYSKFQDKDYQVFIMNPYIIKEFRNRWYAVGYTTLKSTGNKPDRIFNLPFDRIKAIELTSTRFDLNPEDPIYSYFDDVVGTTVPSNQPVQLIQFRVVKAENQANYIRTKHIHQSQTELYDLEDEFWVYFSIQVIPNHELNRVLLSYGKFLEVLSPISLRETLAEHAIQMEILYSN